MLMHGFNPSRFLGFYHIITGKMNMVIISF